MMTTDKVELKRKKGERECKIAHLECTEKENTNKLIFD
jgi:hypothetical protein